MYIILAILGLSFLIFIHELGHYFMARRVGMRVETFAIGFGKPIISWEHDGVNWQIGWLLFGGYVKIAGTETDSDRDPYQIKDGFFGKKPLDRIKVAFMGPFVNLVFAMLLFGLLWGVGGREKNFSEFTPKIGWVDPQSELYAEGVRPGDEIVSYNGHRYESAGDHLYAAMAGGPEVDVAGFKVDYLSGDKAPFSFKAKTYPHPASLGRGMMTVGITAPASYVIYNRLPNGRENPLPKGSPMEGSGLQYGDRVLWVDGQVIFSLQQLHEILNEGKALLTVKRGGETLLKRVPRVEVQELRPHAEFKEELIDWQYESNLTDQKIDKLYAIPYNLTYESVVEDSLRFIDLEAEEEAFPQQPYSSLDEPLFAGDQIVAVDGVPVTKAHELFSHLQIHRANIIVQRDPEELKTVSWLEANADFDREVEWNAVQKIADSIGTAAPITNVKDLQLLKPVTPKLRRDMLLSQEKEALYATALEEQKNEIQAIEDPEQRVQALNLLKEIEEQRVLGIPTIQDRKVSYNPNPTTQFVNVFQQVWRTLTALVSGALNPKWMAGPIGIINVVQTNSAQGIKEAIYWLGLISLNLGVLNLLPIPVLDGGTIVISLMEMITGRQLKPKTLEKLILPFAVLLIGFFLFLTYHDISRIFGGFFR